MSQLVFEFGTYTMQQTKALALDANQEHAAVEEKEVSLPLLGVVVGLGIKRSRHGPYGSSSHFYLTCFL